MATRPFAPRPRISPSSTPLARLSTDRVFLHSGRRRPFFFFACAYWASGYSRWHTGQGRLVTQDAGGVAVMTVSHSAASKSAHLPRALHRSCILEPTCTLSVTSISYASHPRYNTGLIHAGVDACIRLFGNNAAHVLRCVSMTLCFLPTM